jgi:hypothetical protein
MRKFFSNLSVSNKCLRFYGKGGGGGSSIIPFIDLPQPSSGLAGVIVFEDNYTNGVLTN